MQPLMILVAVHDGGRSLAALVASLLTSQPVPEPGVRFLFIDDASSDPQVIELLRAHPFFTRPDVDVVWQRPNRGFVDTVNLGLGSAAMAGEDVLLLNSDTEVHGRAVERLRVASRAWPGAASLMPLTNNGGAASLFNWPRGQALPTGMSAVGLTRVVEAELASAPCVTVPAGTGFCLYLKGTALDRTGLLDPRFSPGYGEETEWCCRATQLGFTHLVCPGAFVVHRGTQSFTPRVRDHLVQAHARRLVQMHPWYAAEWSKHLHADPLRAIRESVLAALKIVQ